jgi:hypothetical protein
VLVGRDSELRQLSELLADGRPVAILGEAGVGKTALARAWAATSGRELVEAGALATLSWLAYLPFRRALGRELVGGDPAFVAREVEDALAGRVLLLDDLHWADSQTREAARFLAERVPLVATIRREDPGAAAAREELADAAVLELEPLAERGDLDGIARRGRPRRPRGEDHDDQDGQEPRGPGRPER